MTALYKVLMKCGCSGDVLWDHSEKCGPPVGLPVVLFDGDTGLHAPAPVAVVETPQGQEQQEQWSS